MHTYKFADCRNIKASELGIDIQGCWRAIPLLPLPTQKKKIYIYIYKSLFQAKMDLVLLDQSSQSLVLEKQHNLLSTNVIRTHTIVTA